jgi:hypothetical protein
MQPGRATKSLRQATESLRQASLHSSFSASWGWFFSCYFLGRVSYWNLWNLRLYLLGKIVIVKLTWKLNIYT